MMTRKIIPTGPIAIVGGRHPVVQATSTHQFQANDTYIADCSSFHIVTGPNMSGGHHLSGPASDLHVHTCI